MADLNIWLAGRCPAPKGDAVAPASWGFAIDHDLDARMIVARGGVAAWQGPDATQKVADWTALVRALEALVEIRAREVVPVSALHFFGPGRLQRCMWPASGVPGGKKRPRFDAVDGRACAVAYALWQTASKGGATSDWTAADTEAANTFAHELARGAVRDALRHRAGD